MLVSMPRAPKAGLPQVDDGVGAGVEGGEGGPDGDGLAGADSEGERLQQLREVLPCEMTVAEADSPVAWRAVEGGERSGAAGVCCGWSWCCRMGRLAWSSPTRRTCSARWGLWAADNGAVGGRRASVAGRGWFRATGSARTAAGGPRQAVEGRAPRTGRGPVRAVGVGVFRAYHRAAASGPGKGLDGDGPVERQAEAARWAWTVVHDLGGVLANTSSRESIGSGDHDAARLRVCGAERR